MRVADKAIVLQSIRYGDKKYILKLYTPGHGLVTANAVVGKGPLAKLRPVSVLPLSLIDAELVLKQNKDVHQLTEAVSYAVLSGIPQSLSKLSIAQFINEVLIRTLKEQHGQPQLFEFIETCLHYLNDAEEGYESLHLYFLSELTKYLGFEPHNDYNKTNPFFDLREGKFGPLALAWPLGLDGESSRLFSDFLTLNGLKDKIHRKQHLLDILLTYYSMHLPGFQEIKSLAVLRELFAS